MKTIDEIFQVIQRNQAGSLTQSAGPDWYQIMSELERSKEFQTLTGTLGVAAMMMILLTKPDQSPEETLRNLQQGSHRMLLARAFYAGFLLGKSGWNRS